MRLLFALDHKLGIEGGIAYVPSRRDLARRGGSDDGGDSDWRVSWSSGSDFSDDAVSDQWGTANAMNEFVARKSFNDPDKGVFVAPPV